MKSAVVGDAVVLLSHEHLQQTLFVAHWHAISRPCEHIAICIWAVTWCLCFSSTVHTSIRMRCTGRTLLATVYSCIACSGTHRHVTLCSCTLHMLIVDLLITMT